MSKYKYIGDGAGITGLPHEVTEEEAAALGASEILKAAIENGSYVKSNPSPNPSPSLRDGEGGKRSKKQEEVNHEQ